MTEEWKDIKGYEGLYQISNLGRVKSIRKNGNILKNKMVKGYLMVNLYNKTNKLHSVHRLVANAFIPNLKAKPQVNHINGNKTDNCVNNLEWCTRRENMTHAIEHNLLQSGESHYKAKLTEKEVTWIRENYIARDSKYGTHGLGKMFNVDQKTISKIVNNKTWNHI